MSKIIYNQKIEGDSEILEKIAALSLDIIEAKEDMEGDYKHGRPIPIDCLENWKNGLFCFECDISAMQDGLKSLLTKCKITPSEKCTEQEKQKNIAISLALVENFVILKKPSKKNRAIGKKQK